MDRLLLEWDARAGQSSANLETVLSGETKSCVPMPIVCQKQSLIGLNMSTNTLMSTTDHNMNAVAYVAH